MRIHHPPLVYRAFTLVLLTACATPPQTQRDATPPSPGIKDAVLNQIEQHYYATPHFDTSLDAREIVRNLDPFSAYFPREKYDRWMQDFKDEDVRFGFDIWPANGHLTIISVSHESA